MVADMLTSPQEQQIPPCVAPMEEDRRNATAERCPGRRGDVPHAPDFHGDKLTRSCKRKLELTSLSTGSGDATEAQDSEKKDPESPPPAKRWVIGPLFQSFKSKMASFTEIVMSPARLFKPGEFPARTGNGECPFETGEIKEDVETDDKKAAFLKKEQTKLPVVQRLIFVTDSANTSDSERDKWTISQNGSEHGRDSGPEDGGSFGSLVPTSKRITNALTASNVERGSGEDKRNCDPIRTRLKKASENKELGEKSQSRAQGQPVGKRKNGRGPEEREPAEKVGKEGGREREEERSTDKQTKTPENPTLIPIPKRTRAQGSNECVRKCSSGDVQLSGRNSREETVSTRASRSRTKTKSEVKDTSDMASNSSATSSPDLLDATVTSTLDGCPSSPASVMSASSRLTRQRKDEEERKPAVAESCWSRDPKERPDSNSRRNNIRRAKPKSAASAKRGVVSKKTRRGKRAMDPFEDQGMSMSLTLKLGSGLDGEKDPSSIMTCGLKTKGKKTADGEILADASCPSGTPPERVFCVGDADVDVEKVEADQQRRWFVYSETKEEVEQEVGLTSPGSIRLKRSLSCPDITSLRHANDAPAAPSDDKTLHHRSPLTPAPRSLGDAPSPLKRSRRHTVCSVEIEREIAPLCLRKEVYPKWGSPSHHSHPHSPSSSLASIISCFLSSPLAFLSKKSSRGHGDDSGYGGSDLTSASASSPSALSLNAFASSGTTSGSTFFADASRTPETSPRSSRCSVLDAVSMAADGGAVQQGSEQSSAAEEEKALSDSEVKINNKQEEQRKVSSIRIRKTLPKPQYNLTPMGLPKAVRIKKKVFTVEEIYTNQNFTRPSEGRLETIFEVPLSRRDGSRSLIGPRRVKRFIEFPELGVARKPKRPPVGGSGVGGAQRKAAGNPVTGRTRRCREAEAPQSQDSDSLLCSKLDELDAWMTTELN